MRGKTVLVTGATAGIGKETAVALAKLGARTFITARNRFRGQAALDEIRGRSGNPDIELLVADFASLAQVRSLAGEAAEKCRQIDVLVNNAGLFNMERKLTVDGYEETFAVNHLAPFLLTKLLLDKLASSAPARIVNVASKLHFNGRIQFEDLMAEKKYSGLAAYAQSKLANILFTYELDRRLSGKNITVNCLHPGGVATDITRSAHWILRFLYDLFSTTAERGARCSIYLASEQEVENISGKYFDENCRQQKSSVLSYDQKTAGRLWDVSRDLTQGFEQSA